MKNEIDMKDCSDCWFMLRPTWTTLAPQKKGQKKTTYKGLVWTSLEDLYQWAETYYPTGAFQVFCMTGDRCLVKGKRKQ